MYPRAFRAEPCGTRREVPIDGESLHFDALTRNFKISESSLMEEVSTPPNFSKRWTHHARTPPAWRTTRGTTQFPDGTSAIPRFHSTCLHTNRETRFRA
jgi:hypothetical protein